MKFGCLGNLEYIMGHFVTTGKLDNRLIFNKQHFSMPQIVPFFLFFRNGVLWIKQVS